MESNCKVSDEQFDKIGAWATLFALATIHCYLTNTRKWYYYCGP